MSFLIKRMNGSLVVVDHDHEPVGNAVIVSINSNPAPIHLFSGHSGSVANYNDDTADIFVNGENIKNVPII